MPLLRNARSLAPEERRIASSGDSTSLDYPRLRLMTRGTGEIRIKVASFVAGKRRRS